MLLSIVAGSLVLSLLTCLLVLRLGSKVKEGGGVVTAAELQSLKEKVGPADPRAGALKKSQCKIRVSGEHIRVQESPGGLLKH